MCAPASLQFFFLCFNPRPGSKKKNSPIVLPIMHELLVAYFVLLFLSFSLFIFSLRDILSMSMNMKNDSKKGEK